MTQTLDLKRRNDLPIVTIGRDNDDCSWEKLWALYVKLLREKHTLLFWDCFFWGMICNPPLTEYFDP